MPKIKIWVAAALLAAAPLAVAHADLPGKHPHYLHALSDLRTARWMVEHRPGDAAVSGHEDVAIQEIDAAIGEVKAAAIDDGKDLHDHPSADAADRPGRLHKAIELLRKVHADVDREEDDPTARGLKHRSLEHVERAIHEAERALYDFENHV
jgi:hypothetical protein